VVTAAAGAWSLLGRSFGPEREVILRVTLMSDHSLQVVRTDGKPLGDLAQTCRELIASAKTDLQLQHLRQRDIATKQTTRRLAARPQEAQVQPPASQAAAEVEDDGALERKRAAAKAAASTRFLRHDTKTVADAIEQRRLQAKAEAPSDDTTASQQPAIKAETSAWDDKGADR